MAVDGALRLCGRGEHRSPAKRLKETFLLSYFCVTKSTKSHQRERSPLFENSPRVHELVAGAVRGECVRQRGKGKIGSFTAPHNFCYTTRANISHEKAEQIRARIACTPAEKWVAGVNLICALKISPISLCSHPDPHHYFDHPVSAKPTEFAPQIGQFPTGEGWQDALVSKNRKSY